MFCKTCGKEINDEAVVCVHCGRAADNKSLIKQKDLSMTAYVLLGIFFAAHRLYAGQKHGVLYLVLEIIAFITFFIIIGAIISFVMLILVIIDISNAVKNHKIIDSEGKEKTI